MDAPTCAQPVALEKRWSDLWRAPENGKSQLTSYENADRAHAAANNKITVIINLGIKDYRNESQTKMFVSTIDNSLNYIRRQYAACVTECAYFVY